MTKTYFIGNRVIEGGFVDPAALWAFDPATVRFERITETEIHGDFGFVGDDLYFIENTYLADLTSRFDGTPLSDGRALVRLDTETLAETRIPVDLPGQFTECPFYLDDRVIFQFSEPFVDGVDFPEGTVLPPSGTYVYDPVTEEVTVFSIPNDASRPDELVNFSYRWGVPTLDGLVFWAWTSFVTDTDSMWFSDGTEDGTVRLTGVADIINAPQTYPGTRSQGIVEIEGADGMLALFWAETQADGRELWVTDGTPEGTQMLDLFSGPESGFGSSEVLIPFKDQALFIGGTFDTGYELFITDGTRDGTRLLYETVPGPSSAGWGIADGYIFGTELIFEADGLWITDGTSEGTRPFFTEEQANLLFDGSPPSALSSALRAGDNLYFTQAGGTRGGTQIFVTDGTPEGTLQLTSESDALGSSKVVASYGDHVLFYMTYLLGIDRGGTRSFGNEFFVTNGTVEGTFKLEMGLPEGVSFRIDTDAFEASLLVNEPDTFLLFEDAPVSSGNDGIRMTSAGELDAGAGNDRIEGSNGDDTLIGGADDDRLGGQDGNDSISGGVGADTLTGGAGDDAMSGGAGLDRAVFSVASGAISVVATAPTAVIVAGAIGGLQITSTEGVDLIASDIEEIQFSDRTMTFAELQDMAGDSGPADPITGTPGNDVLDGTAAPDTINALGGNDTLRGLGGDDTLNAGDGTDTINGGDGNDSITGGETTADRRDTIFAGAGDDSVNAGHGNDLVYGQDGDDVIAGGFGADELFGQNGNDVITGSAFSDLVFGGDGDDFVNGGFGFDRINGGTGADKFFHAAADGHGSDWLQDYSAAEGDVLVFGGSGASASDFVVRFAHTATPAGERSGDDDAQEAFVNFRGQTLWALVDGGGQGQINLQIGADTFDLLA